MYINTITKQGFLVVGNNLMNFVQPVLPRFIYSIVHIVCYNEGFNYFFIIISSSIKNIAFSSGHWALMYHFVIMITKFKNSISAFIAFGMRNNISNSLRFSLISIWLYNKSCNCSQIAFLSLVPYTAKGDVLLYLSLGNSYIY